jgi:hypothetical protein
MILKKVSYLVINQSNSKGILPEWPERGSLKAGLTAIACLTAVACLIAVACLTAIASLTATAYLTATACLTAVVCLTAARKGILPWKVTFNRTQIVFKRYIALEGTFWLYPNIVLINTLPCKVLFFYRGQIHDGGLKVCISQKSSFFHKAQIASYGWDTKHIKWMKHVDKRVTPLTPQVSPKKLNDLS